MSKTALILGGTKGLGLSLAWEADKRGVKQIIAGRDIGFPNILRLPPHAEPLRLDLIDQGSVEQFAHKSIKPCDYIFWVAGNLRRKPLDQMPPEWLDNMIATHLSGPVRVLQLIHLQLHYILKHPYHLVTIASTSSWRVRENETLYCALKATKAAFTRNFVQEMVRDLPGSKATLVNPGGMKTGLFEGTGQDTSKFMEPDVVARIIWDEVEQQTEQFKEVQLMRNDDGAPDVSYGPRTPELPFGELSEKQPRIVRELFRDNKARE